MEGASWRAMHGGQMLVVRRGAIVFDSHKHDSQRDEQRRDGHAKDEMASVPPPAPPPPHRSPSVPLRETAAQRPERGELKSEERLPLRASRVPSLSVPGHAPGHLPGHLGGHALGHLPGTRVLSVVHRTTYRYEKPVEHSTHLYRLRPVHDRMQEVLEHELVLSSKGLRHEYEDVFGNATTRTEVESPYQELRIEARSLVRVREASAHDLFSPERRFTLPLVWMPWQRQMMLPYLLPPELPETQLAELYEYAMAFVERQDHDLSRTLLDLNRTIYRDYKYVSGSTTLATTPFDVYVNRKGVCQDFANLVICLARLLSIPARYRVGYIHTGAEYENKMQSEASHAWVEVYLPWRGWVGFDPTNGCMAGLDHVRVAAGRNYRDATPTSGTIYKGGGFETLSVDVRVEVVGAE
ncbi:MAG: transglutaminase family protein [Sandaracinaceae bacterium]|nr:transglutaminase family protein [Sandaracinaceae bacterium]